MIYRVTLRKVVKEEKVVFVEADNEKDAGALGLKLDNGEMYVSVGSKGRRTVANIEPAT